MPLLLHCTNGEDVPIVSAVIGRRYRFDRSGRCTDLEDFAFTYEPELYDIVHPGRTQPAMVRKDFDAWGYKAATDVVVQGSARSVRPVDELLVHLRCRGRVAFDERIAVTGDRHVERVGGRHRLTSPEPFVEMPMRWDRAYGGTDERAEDELLGDYRKLLAAQLEPLAMSRWSECSYPRNPAGRGYALLPTSVDGLAWPNLEHPQRRLTLEDVVAEREAWGRRPPAVCWDFLPYHWFPRCITLFDPVETSDGRMPEREVSAGLVPPVLPQLGTPQRPWAILGRVASVPLQRHRLRGDEQLRVTHMGPDGDDLRVQLPGESPDVGLRLPGQRAVRLRAVLDLVFVEADEQVVTLVWRASLDPAPAHLPPEWEAATQTSVRWSRR
jgi:hypothetical protein